MGQSWLSFWSPVTGEMKCCAMQCSEATSGKFTLDIRNRFFTEKVVSHRNRLLREMVAASDLSELRSIGPKLLVIGSSFRQSCEEQCVGLADPYGSLPTCDILWFYDSFFYLLCGKLHGCYLKCSNHLPSFSQNFKEFICLSLLHTLLLFSGFDFKMWLSAFSFCIWKMNKDSG